MVTKLKLANQDNFDHRISSCCVPFAILKKSQKRRARSRPVSAELLESAALHTSPSPLKRSVASPKFSTRSHTRTLIWIFYRCNLVKAKKASRRSFASVHSKSCIPQINGRNPSPMFLRPQPWKGQYKTGLPDHSLTLWMNVTRSGSTEITRKGLGRAKGAIPVEGTRASACSVKAEGKEPEVIQPVIITVEDDLELVMGMFEKLTHEKTEFLHHGLENGMTFPPITRKHFLRHCYRWCFQNLTCPPGFPSRQISSVLPKLYIHIGKKERHIERGGHRIIPILNVRALPFINVCKIAQNKKQNRSYICFRRREIKTVRKIRASQATSGAYTLYAFGESKEPQRAFKHGSEQSETTNNATDWRIAFTEARYQQRRSEWNQWTMSVSPTNTPARTSSANDTQQNDASLHRYLPLPSQLFADCIQFLSTRVSFSSVTGVMYTT
ncbi:hypothetical protein JOM56_007683 [Amanita muscaria]